MMHRHGQDRWREAMTYNVTQDKDFGQLVSEPILYKPGNGLRPWIWAQKKCAKYSLQRPNIIDSRIMGDALRNSRC